MLMKKKKDKLIFGVIIAVCLITITPVIPALYLDDLEDVIIDTPYHNQLLQYNSTLVNWTNINYTAVGDGYAGAIGHPHNQELNVTSSVNFGNLTIRAYEPSRLMLGGSEEGSIYIAEVFVLKEFMIEGRNIANFRIKISGQSDLSIDSVGIITTPQQSACRVRLSGTQSVPSGTWTKLFLRTEDYDQNNDYDNGIGARFDVPVTGLYHISYSILCRELPDRSWLSSEIWKNGLGAVGGYEIQSASVGLGGVDLANSGSDIVHLVRNDFIELYVFHNAGGNRDFSALAFTNYISICKIS